MIGSSSLEKEVVSGDFNLHDIHEAVFSYTDKWRMSNKDISQKCLVPESVVEDARAKDEKSLLVVFLRLALQLPNAYFSVKFEIKWQIPKSPM
jgi:hypothetical protein